MIDRDTIIKLAREAGWDEMGADLWGAAFDGAMSIHALERFAALVAAAEREACAQLCDIRETMFKGYKAEGLPALCAEAIRARSNNNA